MGMLTWNIPRSEGITQSQGAAFDDSPRNTGNTWAADTVVLKAVEVGSTVPELRVKFPEG